MDRANSSGEAWRAQVRPLRLGPMKTTRKHYAVFFSPGTFMSEVSTREVPEWDTRIAARLAQEIVERYEARPYGFRFETRIVAGDMPDGEGGSLRVEPKTVATSGMYFINGKLETLEEIEARNDPSERILCSNMRGNGWHRVVVTRNGYRHTAPFEDGDNIVDADGTVIAQ